MVGLMATGTKKNTQKKTTGEETATQCRISESRAACLLCCYIQLDSINV